MKQVLKYYVRVFILLFPVFFLPVVTDPFGFGKNWMILAMALIGMVLFVVDLLINKRDGLKINKAFILMALLTIWAWIGWWKMTLGVRTRSFTDVGGIGTLTAVLGWFFLWLQVTDKEEAKKQLNWLTGAGILTAIVSIIVFVMPASKMPIIWPKNDPILSINSVWSLTGSLISEGLLLLFLVMEWGKRLMEKLKGENSGGYIVEAAITAVLTLVLFLDVFRIFKAGFSMLDGVSGWVIAVETFKRSPIWGIGIGNFWEAFNGFKPTSYNLTKVWAGGFRYSSSGILQLWTELGIVGLGLVAIFVAGFVRLKKNFDFLRMLVMGLIALFLPLNLVGIVLLVWLMANTVFEERKVGLSLKMGEGGFNAAPWIFGVIVVGLTVFGSYWMYRLLLGDIYFRKSLVAASKNDGGGTYNLQISAIGMDPTMAEYRRIYSQTNLALASTILANKDLTEDDKQKASVLIQQSVREAKSAISLDSMDPTYWSNLASIYRQLVGVVDGSADWSFQAYQQAVALDPANPVLKLDLGGLLYAANRFDEADRVFEQVVVAKQDFANGWYNWAYTAKQLGRLGDAVQRLTQAVSLVPVDSGDYDTASKELAVWNKELEEAIKKQADSAKATTAKQAETLKTPEPLPTANKEEKVNVPASELAPPSVSPTVVVPSVSPTPSTGSGLKPTVKPTVVPSVKP
jgi:Tfp pilus assembly protein PilF